MFMKEQVAARKIEAQDSNSKDAFTLLVKSNEQEESKNKLSDDELVGILFFPRPRPPLIYHISW